MKILHIIKNAPDASTKKIIELQKAGNETVLVELYQGPVEYDKLVGAIFASDKVFCW